MNEIWDVRRQILEEAVIVAVLNLFEHMDAAGAFKLSIKNTEPQVLIVAGDRDALLNLLS